MNENEARVAAAQQMKKTYNRIATTTGIAIGIILSVYFFTFAMIIDRLPVSLLVFQLVTALIMIIILFFLKRIGYAGARLRLGKSEPYRELFNVLTPRDLELDDDALAQRIHAAH